MRSWAHQPTGQQQPYYHTDVGTAYSPSPSLIPSSEGTSHLDVHSFSMSPVSPSFNVNSNSKGTIVYPEFVDHLVHPDVDSFKDIPKLPGQTDLPGR
jgi:hypothetical protein